jgi:hypothetical protein
MVGELFWNEEGDPITGRASCFRSTSGELAILESEAKNPCWWLMGDRLAITN